MQIELLSMQDLQQIKTEIVKELKTIMYDLFINQEEWLTKQETKELIGIKSDYKLEQLKNKKEIIYSQHGRTIKYSRKGILEFLNKNIVEDFVLKKPNKNEKINKKRKTKSITDISL